MQHSSGTVEDRCALTADLDTDLDLIEVNELGGDSPNVRGRSRVKVSIAEECSELVCLDLRKQRVRLVTRGTRTKDDDGRTSPRGVLNVVPGL